MSAVKESIGQRLKAAREKRGLSVAKAADEIHLDSWVIDALESGDYARVGPSVYAKGHLKRYAELLGLPVAEILAGYDPDAMPLSEAVQPGSSVRMRTSDPAGSEFPWIQMAGFAVVALIVAGVIWWRPWHPRGTTAPPAVSQPADAAGAVANDDSAAGSVADGSTGAPDADAASADQAPYPTTAVGAAPSIPVSVPNTASPEATGNEGLGRARLRLSFSADAIVDIHDAAGRRVFAGIGRANSVKMVAGAAPLRVYIKAASGVQLEINSHAVAIGPQFVAGDVARFEAGADGVLRRDSHPRG